MANIALLPFILNDITMDSQYPTVFLDFQMSRRHIIFFNVYEAAINLICSPCTPLLKKVLVPLYIRGN